MVLPTGCGKSLIFRLVSKVWFDILFRNSMEKRFLAAVTRGSYFSCLRSPFNRSSRKKNKTSGTCTSGLFLQQLQQKKQMVAKTAELYRGRNTYEFDQGHVTKN